MSSVEALMLVQNFNLSSVQGPLVAIAAVGDMRSIKGNTRRHLILSSMMIPVSLCRRPVS
jgi:hypothetical protein